MSDKRHHSSSHAPSHAPSNTQPHRGGQHGLKHTGHGTFAPQVSVPRGSADFAPVDDRTNHRYLMGGSVTCNAGKLLNLSTTGALVMSRVTLGATVPFVVSDGACRVACTAKVVRTRCMGPHRHSCALQFETLRPEEVAAIEHMIARHHIPSMPMREAA